MILKKIGNFLFTITYYSSIVFFIVLFIGIFYIYFHDFNTEETIVAVIDSGINHEREELKEQVLPGIDLIDYDFEPEDDFGHGTYVAGVIVENAPEAKILPIKTLTENENKKSFSTLGILYALIKGSDVINMSFAQEGENFFTQAIIDLANKKGVLLVASSGNDGAETLTHPARYEGVVSVGSFSESTRFIPSFSNYSKELDFLAPGVELEGLNLHSGTVKKSGTSVSAAYVSGMLAYVKSHYPDWSNEEVVSYLQKNAVSVPYQNYTFSALEMEQLRTAEKEEPYLWSHLYTVSPLTDFVHLHIVSTGAENVQIWIDGKRVQETKGDLNELFPISLKKEKQTINILMEKDEEQFRRRLRFRLKQNEQATFQRAP